MKIKKTIKKIFFLPLLMLNFSWAILPSEGTSANTPSLKYQVSICAIFKNEKKYLREWIEYHRLIGIDHFYLYNNNSIDRPLNILQPYIKQGIVTVIAWPDVLQDTDEEKSALWALSTQVTAYENAIRMRARNETLWLVLMDIDEFLIPSEESSLKELLKKYDPYPGILIHQDCFDAAQDSVTQQNLIIETQQMISSEQIPCTSVEKMIFKPELCEYFTWPPYKYIFKNSANATKVSKQEIRMNRYLHRFKDRLYFGKNKHKLCIDNRQLSDEELQNLLEDDYVIVDQEGAISRYVPEMKKIMGYGGK